jgi:hypothetical protein
MFQCNLQKESAYRPGQPGRANAIISKMACACGRGANPADLESLAGGDRT